MSFENQFGRYPEIDEWRRTCFSDVSSSLVIRSYPRSAWIFRQGPMNETSQVDGKDENAACCSRWMSKDTRDWVRSINHYSAGHSKWDPHWNRISIQIWSFNIERICRSRSYPVYSRGIPWIVEMISSLDTPRWISHHGHQTIHRSDRIGSLRKSQSRWMYADGRYRCRSVKRIRSSDE